MSREGCLECLEEGSANLLPWIVRQLCGNHWFFARGKVSSTGWALFHQILDLMIDSGPPHRGHCSQSAPLDTLVSLMYLFESSSLEYFGNNYAFAVEQ